MKHKYKTSGKFRPLPEGFTLLLLIGEDFVVFLRIWSMTTENCCLESIPLFCYIVARLGFLLMLFLIPLPLPLPLTPPPPHHHHFSQLSPSHIHSLLSMSTGKMKLEKMRKIFCKQSIPPPCAPYFSAYKKHSSCFFFFFLFFFLSLQRARKKSAACKNP